MLWLQSMLPPNGLSRERNIVCEFFSPWKNGMQAESFDLFILKCTVFCSITAWFFFHIMYVDGISTSCVP